MDFVLITLGLVVLSALALVLLARAYPGSGADLVDWRPARSDEAELRLERDDVKQMIDAQNAYRRRHGKPELTERDARRMAAEDQRIRERGRMDERSLAALERSLRRREPD